MAVAEPEQGEWLRPHAAASALGVDPVTLWRYGRDGLVGVRRYGRQGWRRYSRRDIERLLREERT